MCELEQANHQLLLHVSAANAAGEHYAWLCLLTLMLAAAAAAATVTPPVLLSTA
jgi:hypothetical protein